MEFVRGDELVVLQGIDQPPRSIFLSSLACLKSSAALFELYELVPLDPYTQSDLPPVIEVFPTSLPLSISSVLRAFANVFRVPQGLPPARQFDHRIHLLPNSKPVIVRP